MDRPFWVRRRHGGIKKVKRERAVSFNWVDFQGQSPSPAFADIFRQIAHAEEEDGQTDNAGKGNTLEKPAA